MCTPFFTARLLRAFPVEITTLGQLLSPVARFLALLFAWLYFFGLVGMEAFGGRLEDLTEDDVAGAGDLAPYAPRARQVATMSSYGQLRYGPLNFDDMASAQLSLFYLMVVNNWPVEMEGAVAATGTRWSRIFFIAFYAALVVVVSNVLVAFIIDMYQVRCMLLWWPATVELRLSSAMMIIPCQLLVARTERLHVFIFSATRELMP